MVQGFGQIIVQALSLGSLYAILAIGFSLIFGSTRVLNLAHGSFVILAAYIAYFIERYYSVGFIASSIVSSILSLIFLPVLEFIGSRTSTHKESFSLILTFGVALVLQSFYSAMFSSDYRILYSNSTIYNLTKLGLSISSIQLTIILSSLFTIIFLFVMFRKTMTGKALRATIHNDEAALLSGIPVKQMRLLAIGLGCFATGLAGSLYVRVSYVHPAGDIEITLIALLITLFAGRGKIRRVLINAWLFALIETIVSYWCGAKWRELLSSLFIIIVLMGRGEEILNNSSGK
ncbi:MAG: branched-chain amino acid ABC transporter permease [Syntrophobacterales bacterium]|nr:branched-chain amino acid ABC transporter permease [Syntrophobacterales bacterium]